MTLKSINPYTGKLIKEYIEYNQDDINTILNQSLSAFQDWRFTDFSFRSNLLVQVANELEDNVTEYAVTITQEMGKPVKESRAEVLKCAWVCRYYAENAKNHLATEYIKSDAHKSYVTYEPIGTILGIMPWNFPFWQVFRFLAPTLMAGNTALLKHASNVQGCAKHIENIFKNAGYPQGVFQNLVIGSNKVKPLIENDIISAVTLTGSEYAGSQVAAEAGLNIKKSVLELGGSNAFIVLDDADIDAAVEEAIKARMMNGGQSCIASKRFILLDSIADIFIKKYTAKVQNLKVGDPMNEGTDIGPLSSVQQAEEVERQVNESIESGARLLTGSGRQNAFYSPTVLDNVTPEMSTFKEEVFGPVASMIRAENADEAIGLVNKSKFGLGATIYTRSYRRAEKLIPMIDDGAVFINSLVKSDPRLPFGGTKKSGYGRELSLHGIREFVNIKTVYFA